MPALPDKERADGQGAYPDRIPDHAHTPIHPPRVETYCTVQLGSLGGCTIRLGPTSGLRHRHRACGLCGELASAPIIVLTQVLARLKIKLLADMF